jgi:lipopolysaccharide transport system ATP-binding protein
MSYSDGALDDVVSSAAAMQSHEDVAIQLSGVGKCYRMYRQPADRLKELVRSGFSRWSGLKMRALHASFWALRNVTLAINKGETVGIIGRNGSGKSTLLQMLCGILTPSAGTIDVKGRVAALLELGAGFNPDFSGLENIYVSAAVMGLSREETESRLTQIIEFADIGEFINRPVKTYSSGMYVRLAFAVAISASPDILVVDEALAVGDEPFQRKCYARIAQIRAAGATIIVVSHSTDTLLQLCTRAVLLDGGAMVCVGEPKAVIDAYYALLNGGAKKSSSPTDGGGNRELPVSADGDCTTGSEESRSNVADDSFDPGLRPQSTLTYDSVGAIISEVKILDLTQRRVNVLAPGKEYVYTYRVRFDVDASRVYFGMLIKTVEGLELGAAGSHRMGDGVEAVSRGSCFIVSFRFRNVFSPGVYFTNAGCAGNVEGRDVFMHRIVDALAFRVERSASGLHYAGPLQLVSVRPEIREVR